MPAKPQKTLLIVGYYSLADGFLTCANYLSKEYKVLFFPLLYYENNKLNLVEDLSKYIKGEKLLHYVENLRPNESKVDIVLLWYHSYFCVDFSKINEYLRIKKSVGSRVKFIGYNWDPMSPTEGMISSKIQMISVLDYYLTGDSSEISYLAARGLSNIGYCQSGFDPNVTYPMVDEKYQCDVSIVCTNLYTNYKAFPLEYVRLNRKKLVDLIYENRGEIKFHIYGPPFLQQLYPDCYRGYVKYSDCNRVFHNSKINLCIHAVSYNSIGEQLYFSERLPQILGSHGLLYCETEYSHQLKPECNYVLADIENPIGQIKDILRNYSKYITIRENGYKLATEKLTWDNLRLKLNKVIEIICK